MLILAINALCGCEKQNVLIDKYENIADYFVYDMDYNSPMAMAAGEGAELFTVELSDSGTVVRKYNENGNVVNEFPVDYAKIYDIYYHDNSLYIGFAGDKCAAVDSLDIRSGNIESICEFAELSDIRSISAIGNEVVAIGTDFGKDGLECRYMINGYSQAEYSGRGIYTF